MITVVSSGLDTMSSEGIGAVASEGLDAIAHCYSDVVVSGGSNKVVGEGLNALATDGFDAAADGSRGGALVSRDCYQTGMYGHSEQSSRGSLALCLIAGQERTGDSQSDDAASEVTTVA